MWLSVIQPQGETLSRCIHALSTVSTISVDMLKLVVMFHPLGLFLHEVLQEGTKRGTADVIIS